MLFIEFPGQPRFLVIRGWFVTRVKQRRIAWLLAWMYLTLSAAGEALHGLPGMGHTVQCGRVALWVGGGSSSGGPTSALSVRCSACHCPRPHGPPEDQDSSAERISAASIQPDACCPICSYLAMGKWFAAAREQAWVGCLVGVASTLRIVRPDAKPHRCVLARGPPRKAGVDS